MAERLAHRDLRNHSAEVLRDVAAGATYEVTNHGRVVAVLSPPGSGQELRIRTAKAPGGFGELVRRKADQPSAAILDDLRSDR
jgi:prevent-host-death family protein